MQVGTHSQTVATYGHIAASSTGVQDMADSSHVLTSLQGSPQVSHLKLLVLQYTRDNAWSPRAVLACLKFLHGLGGPSWTVSKATFLWLSKALSDANCSINLR